MSPLPSYELEARAADERKRLHSSVTELKDRVRERFDVKTNVREHVLLASGVAAVFSAALGYGLVGMFTRN